MGRDKEIGPGLTIMLLASLTIGAVYWTSTFVEGNNSSFEVFSNTMDVVINQAYGFPINTDKVTPKKEVQVHQK